jgi:4a-hydroxytetrahydrobiopterin dehydratase
VNRVGELAERENHHPDVSIHWNKVTLRWWTHVADAVTERDYELAERSNDLVGEPEEPDRPGPGVSPEHGP